MKKHYFLAASALTLCIAGSVAAGIAQFDMAAFKAAVNRNASASVATEYEGTPSAAVLSKFADSQAPVKAPAAGTALPKGVTVDTVLYKSFADWTAGTMDKPDAVNVGEDEALYNRLLGADSEWMVYRAYQAGGAMYLGFDYTGDGGSGYFMTPAQDFGGDNVAFRLKVTAMNVNANAQDQGLQAFFMNQAPGSENGSIFSASSVPMNYNEWTTCEWIEKTDEARKYIRAMAFGWKGEVLVKDVTLEKLTYPLASVKDITLDYWQGTITAEWAAVEGAVSYKAVLYRDGEEDKVQIAEAVVDAPIAEWDIPLSEDCMRYIVTVVAIDAEGGESYPSSNYALLYPDSVGAATALPATEVSEKGFTANWEAVAAAARTLVYPVQTHTATEPEYYSILSEDFHNIPLYNDSSNPVQVIPMLGMGNMDAVMSRAGWQTDCCFFFRLDPEFPALILSNMFAAYGMPGYVMSPVYDLSVGNGKVGIAGFMASAADEAVVTFYLVDAATGEAYASEDVEVTPEGTMFEIALGGGRPNSCIKFEMTDTADEEMTLVPMLEIYCTLDAGQTITGPIDTEVAYAPATSIVVNSPVDANNTYTYTVQGAFRDIFGAQSEPIEVKAGTNGVASALAADVRVYADGKMLRVDNPAGESVTVATADGKIITASSGKAIAVEAPAGVVLVNVAGKTFKVVL